MSVANPGRPVSVHTLTTAYKRPRAYAPRGCAKHTRLLPYQPPMLHRNRGPIAALHGAYLGPTCNPVCTVPHAAVQYGKTLHCQHTP